MNWDHGAAPIHRPIPTEEAGMLAGYACDVVSVRPHMMKPVPSVVMKEGSPMVTVRNPLNQPTTSPMTSEAMMASQAGTP
jgi:hypothetical protein